MAVNNKKKMVQEEAAKEKATEATSKPNKKPADDPGRFCVYIGPSIRGVIQSNTIFPGTKPEVEKRLTDAIERYPLIAKLISPDKTFAEDRIKVNTAGNVLNVYYNKLASGKSN